MVGLGFTPLVLDIFLRRDLAVGILEISSAAAVILIRPSYVLIKECAVQTNRPSPEP